MIKRLAAPLLMLILTSCSNIQLLLVENNSINKLKGNTSVILSGSNEKRFAQEIFSFFGNNKNGDYILVANFSEKKENRLVKKNQVAEKIDYELSVDYEVFYKQMNCKIFNKRVVSKFSFVPKSFGYNFGTDRSFEKLYIGGVNKNIREFINLVPEDTSCLQ
mgnify:CR=1 FL=1